VDEVCTRWWIDSVDGCVRGRTSRLVDFVGGNHQICFPVIGSPLLLCFPRVLPGYSRYYKALSEYLSSQLGDKVEMVGVADRGVTGNFEVTVATSGQILHSRKAGQGKAETSSARAAILVQIEDLLEKEQ
jgi:hypothetical protein